MISPVYHNLNKVDSILKEEFGSKKVTMDHVERRTNSGVSFDFKFTIESGNYTLKILLNGRDTLMMEDSIAWSYFPNTNDESDKISKISRLSDLSNSVKEIFDKKMFSNSYLESVQYSINESKEVDAEPILKKPLFMESNGIVEISKKALTEFMDNYGLSIGSIDIFDNDQLIVSVNKNDLSPLSKFEIETSFMENSIIFNARFGMDKLYLDFNSPVKLQD